MGKKRPETEKIMRHIFLTGAVQTGKSTAIRRFLCANRAYRAGGFITVSRPSAEPGFLWDVFILPHDYTESDILPARLVGRRSAERGGSRAYPAAFDAEGTALLRREGHFDLLLMDELGRMELGAPLFRAAVLHALDGSIPVLGVIKPEHNEFLDAVRAHENVTVLEVTEENRDAIPARIAALWEE